jgi:hypothetical protein
VFGRRSSIPLAGPGPVREEGYGATALDWALELDGEESTPVRHLLLHRHA